MPAAPSLPTGIVAGNTGHIANTNTVHAVVNNIYLSSVGSTKTTAYTLTQADSGEVVSVNAASAVAITVPSLAAGTSIELLRYGVGGVTLTASGTTLLVPTGSAATPRAQYSRLSLLWRTTTEVVVGGDLSLTNPSVQTLGVFGVATPAGAILTTSDTSSQLNISTSGTATAPRVYDGQGHTTGRINVTADYVVVQNFNIVAGSQYGAYLDGTNITFQNNDISGVIVSGDGDLNAITVFGNNHRILYNTAINFVTGNPAGSHTDFVQTWVSTSHPVAGSNWAIVGNKVTGPANPSRLDTIASLHQGVIVEDYGTGGNTGGSTSGISGWFIADNEFGDSWNQCIKIDGGDNFVITRNKFTGSSDYVCQFASGTGNVFYSDNVITGSYGAIGVTVTSGLGPATPRYV